MTKPREKAKIIYLTAGAGGMFCGSCLHDNALARAMAAAGWDIQLIPAYTPIRTDETDVSVDHVVFGGLNVYLQQKIPLLRHLPGFLDRFLDNPRLIRRLTANAMNTNPKTLGSLALSMLKGEHGNQRKEVRRLCDWLEQQRPDLLVFSNILIGGCIKAIKQQLSVPIVVTLQGDDVFLESLIEPYKSQCMDQIRQLVQLVDGFIVHTEFFRDRMAVMFGIDPTKIHVAPLCIDTTEFQGFNPEHKMHRRESGEVSIGYLARLAPEKGLASLVDAFIDLHSRHDSTTHLAVAGWLGADHQDYAQQQWDKLERAGLADGSRYLGEVDRNQKLKFLSDVDVFSVPASYLEPKGLYVLEAMAAGVPVVLPDHGAFSELVRQSGGGLQVRPGDVSDLADSLHRLAGDQALRDELGAAGYEFAHTQRNSDVMVETTGKIFEAYL